jgi:hypothetical protein
MTQLAEMTSAPGKHITFWAQCAGVCFAALYFINEEAIEASNLAHAIFANYVSPT